MGRCTTCRAPTELERPCTLTLNFPSPFPAVRPCPMPPEVANGNHNGRDKAFFTAGMSVRYSCDPGYYLVGNAAVSCRASGNWSQPRPRCEGESGLCPPRQVGGHGLLSAPGQTVTFQCHDGYSLQGSASLSCQEDGSWQAPAPVCDRLMDSGYIYNGYILFIYIYKMDKYIYIMEIYIYIYKMDIYI
uniref:Uncharacterized protein n=1 Tax=Geospiza parvula TaxID=87175 RepID=A0A8C3MVU1_GEOPR